MAMPPDGRRPACATQSAIETGPDRPNLAGPWPGSARVSRAARWTSSPRRIVPGRSTSPKTPNIRSLPSTQAAVVLDRAERVEVALRRSRGRGSSSRSGRPASLMRRIASPIPTRRPTQVSSSWASAAFELDQHPEAPGVDGAGAEDAGERARSSRRRRCWPDCARRVPPGRSQRTMRISRPQESPQSGSPTARSTTCPTPVRPWIARLDGLAEPRPRPRRPCRRGTSAAGPWRLGIGLRLDLDHRRPRSSWSTAGSSRRSGRTAGPRGRPLGQARSRRGARARGCAPARSRRLTVGMVADATGRRAGRPDLTSGRRRTASRGSARGAPPRCPSPGRGACRAGR